MTITINATTTFKQESCYRCGVIFAMTSEYTKQRLRDHESFWCPNGHRQAYLHESQETRLERELANAERATSSERRMKEAARRSSAAYRGQVTKIKRRVSRGVCPCCNRTFADLGKHMSGKHPDWTETE